MTKAIITCKSGRKFRIDNFWSFSQQKDTLFVEFNIKELHCPYAKTVLYMAKNSIESIDLIEAGDEHDNR